MQVKGFAEYLLHTDFQLGFYDYVVEQTRHHKSVELILIQFTDADLMDLGPLLAKSLEDLRTTEEEKYAESGDGYEIDPPEPNSYIPIKEITWPFRVRVPRSTLRGPSLTRPRVTRLFLGTGTRAAELPA